jgi:predicted  nucleic acid-binding Zn-ribbon protein
MSDLVQPGLFGDDAVPAPVTSPHRARRVSADVESLQYALLEAHREIETLKQQLADAETDAQLRIAKVRETSQAMAQRQIAVLEAEIDRLREALAACLSQGQGASSSPRRRR